MKPSIFKPFECTWNGVKYVILAQAIMPCIADVENVVTLGELAQMQAKGRLALSKLAIAYGILLRCAGADVSDEDVYLGMFRASGAELQSRAFGALITLQSLMIPPEALRAEPGKTNGGGEARTADSSPSITSS